MFEFFWKFMDRTSIQYSPTKASLIWIETYYLMIRNLYMFRSTNKVKSRPNDRNMPTQHIATLLGATCCVRLATVLRFVATCWVLLAQVWKWSNLSQKYPTCRNRVAKRMQHFAPNNVTVCYGILRSFGRDIRIHYELCCFRTLLIS